MTFSIINLGCSTSPCHTLVFSKKGNRGIGEVRCKRMLDVDLISRQHLQKHLNRSSFLHCEFLEFLRHFFNGVSHAVRGHDRLVRQDKLKNRLQIKIACFLEHLTICFLHHIFSIEEQDFDNFIHRLVKQPPSCQAGTNKEVSIPMMVNRTMISDHPMSDLRGDCSSFCIRASPDFLRQLW